MNFSISELHVWYLHIFATPTANDSSVLINNLVLTRILTLFFVYIDYKINLMKIIQLIEKKIFILKDLFDGLL